MYVHVYICICILHRNDLCMIISFHILDLAVLFLKIIKLKVNLHYKKKYGIEFKREKIADKCTCFISFSFRGQKFQMRT